MWKYAHAITMAIMILLPGLTQGQNMNPELHRLLKAEADQQEVIHFLIKGDIPVLKNKLRELGGTCHSTAGDVASVSLPLGKISNLLMSDGLDRIEYIPTTGTLMCDQMLINNNIIPAHQGLGNLPQALDGEGVIIGIIDAGIDWRHPDFQNADGSSRILWIWDQNYGTSSNTPQPYNYGQEWSKAVIDAGNCPHDEPLNQFGHGSNVAGVAVSNGLAINNYKGVAPRADIIAVGVKFDQNFLSRVSDAIEYVFKKADEEGKPCVVNTSLGTYGGSHDGRDLTSEFIDNLITAKNGRVVVAAAGNAGNIPFHLGYDVTSDTSFTWFSYYAPYNFAAWQVWADTAEFNDVDFSVFVTDPTKGHKLRYELPWMNLKQMGLNTGSVITQSVDFIVNGNNLGKLNMYFAREGDRYQLEFFIQSDSTANIYGFETTGSGHLDCWSHIAVTGTSTMVTSGLPSVSNYPNIVNYQYPDYKMTMVSSWQNSDKVITVANYNNREQYVDYNGNVTTVANSVPGVLGLSSSEGPTRDGRFKPDIAATGNTILSATPLSYLASQIVSEPTKVAAGGYHRRNGGTSMASPVVAGVAALYLQMYPDASWEEVQLAIEQGAFEDQHTGPVPNPDWGYGKLDGFAALNVIRGCTDPIATNYNPVATIDDSSCTYFSGIADRENVFRLFPNPAANEVVIDHRSAQQDLSVTFTDISGRVLLQQPLSFTNTAIDIASFSSGIYIVSLHSGEQVLQRIKLVKN